MKSWSWYPLMKRVSLTLIAVPADGIKMGWEKKTIFL